MQQYATVEKQSKNICQLIGQNTKKLKLKKFFKHRNNICDVTHDVFHKELAVINLNIICQFLSVWNSLTLLKCTLINTHRLQCIQILLSTLV